MTDQSGPPEQAGYAAGGYPPGSGGGYPYTGPPPTGFPPPPGSGGWHGPYGQPVDPYAGAPSPYGAPPPSPYGYSPPPYALAYQQNPADRRPGTATASAVLGYVNAGLLTIAALILFTGAKVSSDLNDFTDGSSQSYTAEFVVDGVLNLLAVGLLISGAVAMSGRSPIGRIVFAAGNALVIGESIYWLARWASKDGLEWIIIYAVLFGALAVIALPLALTPDVTRWLNRRPRTF